MFHQWKEVTKNLLKIRYGSGVSEVSKSIKKRNGETVEDSKVDENEFVFSDSKINDSKWKSLEDHEKIQNFFLALSLCHTVVIDNTGKYSASSPDEDALVVASKHLGFEFKVTYFQINV
jgi:magnesium-transporting ATPase (P-type)